VDETYDCWFLKVVRQDVFKAAPKISADCHVILNHEEPVERLCKCGAPSEPVAQKAADFPTAKGRAPKKGDRIRILCFCDLCLGCTSAVHTYEAIRHYALSE
jgi:hypothetical protein